MASPMNPTFSVVIAFHDPREQLLKSVDSVLAQSRKDYELIVVGDGASDLGVLEAERIYAQVINEAGYIKVFSQPPRGINVARNRGIAEARGELIAFLEVGDTWEPHYLEELCSLRAQFRQSRCYGAGYQLISNGEHYSDPDIHFSVPTESCRVLDDYFQVGAQGDLPFTLSSFCIERSFVEELGAFANDDLAGEAQDLFCRAALNTDIAYTPSVLAFTAKTDAPSMSCPQEEYAFSRRLAEYAKSMELPPKTADAVNDYRAAQMLKLAALNLQAGRVNAANHLLEHALCKRHWMRYLWWKMRAFTSARELDSKESLHY